MPFGIETTVVGARLTASVRAALQHRATDRGVTISAMAAIGIEEWLDPDPPEARTQAKSAKPAQSPAPLPTPPQRLVAAVIATIAAEIRHEQNRPVGPSALNMPMLLDTPELANVTDLRSARAAGTDAWINAGCGPGLIAILFPGDRTAIRAAKQSLNRRLTEQRRSKKSPARQAAARFGISGKGSTILARILDEDFPGMTIEQAIAQGPAAWLSAGVTEAVARALFDEATADEARRLGEIRHNADRRQRT